MKKVLVTGENGYIGSSFKKWIKKNEEEIVLEYISVRNKDWEKMNFSQYDVVLHLAGIAHVSRNAKYEQLYYKINRDLSIQLAEKSKREGVNHFIFMSSIIVYGKESIFDENRGIDKNTIPIPEDFYGRSKLEADLVIQGMSSDNFKTTVIRCPLVYGPKSKGNFSKLLNLSKFAPIFFEIDNKRSMIFIENLLIFIVEIIKKEAQGLFFPQNKEYVNTKDIVKYSALLRKRKIVFFKVSDFFEKHLFKNNEYLNKIFGNKFYIKEDNLNIDYQKIDFKESISKTLNVEDL